MYLCGLNFKTILKHSIVIIHKSLHLNQCTGEINLKKNESIPDDETIVPIELDLMSGPFDTLLTMGGISVVVSISV